jgi:3-hydroxyacyl-CoA dehydrogenase
MQPTDVRSVGLIGAGRLGHAMAQVALRAGRRVVIANSHGPESLTAVVKELGDGVSAGTVKDAAAADLVAPRASGEGRQHPRRARTRLGPARGRRSACDLRIR